MDELNNAFERWRKDYTDEEIMNAIWLYFYERNKRKC